MFEDGTCQKINKLNNSGWSTLEADDWIYYPQQYGKPTDASSFDWNENITNYMKCKCIVNISMTAAAVSVAIGKSALLDSATYFLNHLFYVQWEDVVLLIDIKLRDLSFKMTEVHTLKLEERL
jgi:hypothetical protein